MATILAISSFVARGTVGLRAIMPALDRLGHEVIACPTILLSNHLGHPRADGAAVASQTFAAMLAALDGNGWLASVDAVITGYLPSPEHVRIVEATIRRVRTLRPDALVVCDPVLGDDPGGFYVPEPVAHEVKARLVPSATHVKPNRFELEFLSGKRIAGLDDVPAAARSLAVPVVLASSVPLPGDKLANVIVTRDQAAMCTVDRQPDVPHGTGDLLTTLFTVGCLSGLDPAASAAGAAAGVRNAITVSRGTDELRLASSDGWHQADPLPLQQLVVAAG